VTGCPGFPQSRICTETARKTVDWWALYKRQTGTWPWSSIAIHFMNWVVVLFGGGVLIWWTVEHQLSRWQFLGVFLLVSLPYGILKNWAKRKVKLNHLRNGKRLAKLRDEQQTISAP
jgi:type VI protein secretion system component VasK